MDIEARVNEVEINQAILKNDIAHIVQKLQELVDQLKIHNEKLPEIIHLDKRLTQIEIIVSDIQAKQSMAWWSKITPGQFLTGVVVILLILMGQTELLKEFWALTPK